MLNGDAVAWGVQATPRRLYLTSGVAEMMSLLGIVVLVALIAWLMRLAEQPSRYRPPTRSDDDDIDHEELEAAEREVRDLGAFRRPDDEEPGDDWGPGTARRPRPPEQL